MVDSTCPISYWFLCKFNVILGFSVSMLWCFFPSYFLLLVLLLTNLYTEPPSPGMFGLFVYRVWSSETAVLLLWVYSNIHYYSLLHLNLPLSTVLHLWSSVLTSLHAKMYSNQKVQCYLVELPWNVYVIQWADNIRRGIFSSS